MEELYLHIVTGRKHQVPTKTQIKGFSCSVQAQNVLGISLQMQYAYLSVSTIFDSYIRMAGIVLWQIPHISRHGLHSLHGQSPLGGASSSFIQIPVLPLGRIGSWKQQDQFLIWLWLWLLQCLKVSNFSKSDFHWKYILYRLYLYCTYQSGIHWVVSL